MAFYCDLFGWTKVRTHDMGPMGGYHILAIDGQEAVGIMTKPAHVPHPCWMYYVDVDGLDAAIARVAKAKGKLLSGPMEVPGGSWIAQCADPQGAHIAMVSRKR